MNQLRQGGYLISKIHQLAGRIFSEKLKEYQINEINPAQGRILFALWQEDGISIQELSNKTALGKSTLSRMLDRLEESGHLVRVFTNQDRRKILVQLTDENKRVKDGYKQVSEEMVELFYNGFTDVEIQQFEDQLHRIYTNMMNYKSQKKKGKYYEKE